MKLENRTGVNTQCSGRQAVWIKWNAAFRIESKTKHFKIQIRDPIKVASEL